MVRKANGRYEVAWEEFLRELNSGEAQVDQREYFERVSDRLDGRWLNDAELKAILEEELEALAVSYEMVAPEGVSQRSNSLRISSQPLMRAVREKLVMDGHIVLKEDS